jgi:trans-2,3-dihydro-3-hydroxyanthranilate isomerase
VSGFLRDLYNQNWKKAKQKREERPMRKIPFCIVDVFAEERYAGNPLAVFLDAGELSSAEMQQIAGEMNYSETTFVTARQPQHNGFNVRIFTPAAELPFAGHPTLGTAYIIRREILQRPTGEIRLNLPVGQIPVEFGPGPEPDQEVLWMLQIPPVFGKTFERSTLAEILRLDPDDFDPDYPVQEVSTGLPFIIVPLRSLAAVKKARVNTGLLQKLVQNYDAKAVLVFAPETYHPEHQLNVRVFVDEYAIPEDPATGSANGCLAGYLARYRYFKCERIDLRVEQGYEIGRPSLLYLQAEADRGEITIRVGGKVRLNARGEWF